MSQYSDLVHDSRLSTRFVAGNTIHTYLESTTVFNRRARRQKRVETWVRSKELGRGSFGIVWLERCPRDNSLRAVKEITKKKIRENVYHRELEAIIKFSHHRYEGLFVRSFGWYDNKDSVFIAMEHIVLGDLQKHLKQALPEDEAARVVKQVLEGLECMHDNGFAHRDLKPENIFVVEKPPDKWWVKIGDFGISKRVGRGATELRTINGTPGFIAPEIALRQLYDVDVDESSYDFTVDLWSLGVIAFYMLTLKHPFLKLENLLSYARGDLAMSELCLKYSVINEKASSFLGLLMAPKAKDRGTAKEALKHSWLPKDDVSPPESRRNTPVLLSPSPVTHRADTSSESEPEVSTFTTLKSTASPTPRRDSPSRSESEVMRFTTMDQSAYPTNQSAFHGEPEPNSPTGADMDRYYSASDERESPRPEPAEQVTIPEQITRFKEHMSKETSNESPGAWRTRPKPRRREEIHEPGVSKTTQSGSTSSQDESRHTSTLNKRHTSQLSFDRTSKLMSWLSPRKATKSAVPSERHTKLGISLHKKRPDMNPEKIEKIEQSRSKETKVPTVQKPLRSVRHHLKGREKPAHFVYGWSVKDGSSKYVYHPDGDEVSDSEREPIQKQPTSSSQRKSLKKLTSRPKRPDTPPPPKIAPVRYGNNSTDPSKPIGLHSNFELDPYASYPGVPPKTPDTSISPPHQPDTPPPTVAPVRYEIDFQPHPSEHIDPYPLISPIPDFEAYQAVGLPRFPDAPPRASNLSVSSVETGRSPSRASPFRPEYPPYTGESGSLHSSSSSTSDPVYEARKQVRWWDDKPRHIPISFEQHSRLGPDDAIEMSDSAESFAAETGTVAQPERPDTPPPSWAQGKALSSSLWLPDNGYDHHPYSPELDRGSALDPYIVWERTYHAVNPSPDPDGYTRLPKRCYNQYALNEMGIRNFTNGGNWILVYGSLTWEVQLLLQQRTCELRRRAIHIQHNQPVPEGDDRIACCLSDRKIVRLENTTSLPFRFPFAYIIDPGFQTETMRNYSLPPYDEIGILIASPSGKPLPYSLMGDEIRPEVLAQHKIAFSFWYGRLTIDGVFSADKANSLIEETWSFYEDICRGTRTMQDFSESMGPNDSDGNNMMTPGHYDEPKGSKENQALPSPKSPPRQLAYSAVLNKRWRGARITAVEDTFDADSGFDPGVERHMQPELQHYNPFENVIYLSPGPPASMEFNQYDRRSNFMEVERIYHPEYPHEPSDASGYLEYERRYHRDNPWLYKKVPYNSSSKVLQAGIDTPFNL